MSNNTQQKITKLRKVEFKDWSLSLWLVKRKLATQVASYSVLRVDIDKKLQKKLKTALSDKVQSRDYKLEEYDFLTSDQDDQLFTLESQETDFKKIQEAIDQGLHNHKAQKYEDLLDSWAFVVKMEYDGDILYGVRKVNNLTNAAKMAKLAYFIFDNQQLVDLEDKKVFTIDTNIDFFVYGGVAFIANKKEFESVLNFRHGMESNRDKVLNEFADLEIFTDIDAIKNTVGSNIRLLRKVSAIQKSGYYKNKDFLKNLISVNNQKGWGLTLQHNKIVVTEDNVELVLTLLNNSRLESPINHELFDASVKKRVE
ncbi:Kiwa anti-phage protein KwaB-like domain-containing protein [Methylomonas koyamae]|uniref:DUF4868 domain-containing protein n=1 Tax=Methylomonas koyamae TaxID=702114 RepID=A0A177NXE1_9GAMM|nr:Kiwa anti-phage protein KwaB-like domain-containing protein [Methylomonas koyamae]ATG89825.1 hypothetical protein MKLM6_1581 [Methylomonas koyamae]OAI21933.1 hypothetical protein A1356_20140 [Methylomonas koyamae]OAI22331.1 hypothetical protein A1356_19335 [Methylomonas koyamae]WNB74427.1 DUF4868 domain-containing protein [Methylomonas koyamae]